MKQFVLIFVLMLFFALTGCEGVTPSDGVSTHVVETITALSYTPTPNSTPDPMENPLVLVLNSSLANTNQLSQALEAKYYVLKVEFSGNSLQEFGHFFIEIHCECVNNSSCCSAKRTLVTLTDAMKYNSEIILRFLPPDIKTLQVSCYDHEKSMEIISVPWDLMLQYFRGNINGLQLGGEINKLATPTP